MASRKRLSLLLLLLFLLTGTAFAQKGIKGGTDGVNQINTKTLGKFGFMFGGSGYISADSWAMIMGGRYTVLTIDGAEVNRVTKIGFLAPSIDLFYYGGIGITDNWDAGITFPFYSDLTASLNGLIGEPENNGELEMWASGPGDIELWTKVRMPFIPEEWVFSMALQFDLTLPTGEVGYGTRIRHPWYYNMNGFSNAFTSDRITWSGTMVFTFDLGKRGKGVRWNSWLGMLLADDFNSNTLLWGTGLDFDIHEKLTFFGEFNAESRFQRTDLPRMPFDLDPMILTGGFRWHMTERVDFLLAGDLGMKVFYNFWLKYRKERRMAHGYQVYHNSGIESNKDKYTSSYGIVNEPRWGARMAFTFHFPTTPAGCPACPPDEDEDGVLDTLDQCPHTPHGIKVKVDGCPVDTDKDGVFDYLDQCPNTPEGVTVDQHGCPFDDDEDGVINEFDKCPETIKGYPVDSVGCDLDFDHDGVLNVKDLCPNTPAGYEVDSTGCFVDTDKDGVFDYRDQCPGTPEGTVVDSIGCDYDIDKDGVVNPKDWCPSTLPGVKVDSVGCPLDKKQDLDYLKKGILFQTGSHKLQKRSFKVLNDLVTLMNDIPELNLEIQGHTDNRGSREKNIILSKNRAQSAVNYLVSKKVENERLRAEGYGPDKPVADNNTAKGRQQNRRVELVPFKPEPPADTTQATAPADTTQATAPADTTQAPVAPSQTEVPADTTAQPATIQTEEGK